MKTRKYFLEVEFCESAMIRKMEISKKEFDKQMKFLRNQTIMTQDYECPIVEPEWSNKKFDHTTYTETCYVFNSGCCVTFLSVLEAKEGYCFKQGEKHNGKV